MKTSLRKYLCFCLAVTLCLTPVTVTAYIKVILKDGRVFKLPIKQKYVKAIVVNGKQYFPGSKGGKRTDKQQTRKRRARSNKARLSTSSDSAPKTILVGPSRKIRLPSQAARLVKGGDTIEIDAAEYLGDVAVWRANYITLRGVGGHAHLNADGKSAQRKAIWVIKGDNVTVENIVFSNAKVRDRNGAGIRAEGNNLTVRNCLFHDNENGILGGGNRNSNMLVEHSVFARNGHGDGQSHGIYVGNIKQLTFQFNYVHHTKIGHQVKSRAQENFILYNKLVDEKTGNSSYAIDMPNGHVGMVIGNILQQSSSTDNHALVHFRSKVKTPGSALCLINNTVVNERHSGVFVINSSPVQAKITNNILVGNIQLLVGPGAGEGNLVADISDFVSPKDYDFHLKPGASAVDAGVDPGKHREVSLRPVQQYIHPAGKGNRPNAGRLDAGAFEFEPAKS